MYPLSTKKKKKKKTEHQINNILLKHECWDKNSNTNYYKSDYNVKKKLSDDQDLKSSVEYNLFVLQWYNDFIHSVVREKFVQEVRC